MFTKTEHGEKILWCLLEDDAQEIATEMINRELTEEELVGVANGLGFGFEFWEEVMRTSIAGNFHHEHGIVLNAI